jgi:hypothetical protein
MEVDIVASKSLISLANIPVEDIFTYLTIVKGVSVRAENAADTDKVCGIDSDKIAMAAVNNEGDLIEDRNTVQNALNLGGKAADQYLLKDDSTTLLGDTYAVSTTLSNEIKEIRDEVYQLKSQLAKQGYIMQSKVYDGFYDAFRDGEIRYDDTLVTQLSSELRGSSSNAYVINADNISEGDYLGFKLTDGTMQSAQVQYKQNGALVLRNTLGVSVPAGANVYRYAGSYNNGEFIFGKNYGRITSVSTEKVVVKDGKDRNAIQVLGEDTKGFATKLSSYYCTYGSIIRKVEFSLAVKGNPGSIKASIWKVNFNSFSEAVDYECLGSSDSVYPSSCSGTLSNVVFNFAQPIRISEGATYLIALYCGGADAENTWKIGGYTDDTYESLTNMWYTDDTYYFDGERFPYVIPGATDAYLALHISQEMTVNIQYEDNGVYACKEEMQCGFTRVRVELRVNREGIYQTTNNGLSVVGGNKITIAGDKAANPFAKGDFVVIGNSFSKISKDSSVTGIFCEDSMYTPEGADVYRVGYKVQVKCKKKTSEIPLIYGDETIVELPLVAVIPGKEPGKENSSSDRLIFEAEIKNNEEERLEMYHQLELQIAWDSPITTINENPQFAGKILDLSVSTDKSFKK